MTPEDIFLGPLLRRVSPEVVVICLATFSDHALRFVVKDADGEELGADADPVRVRVSEKLFFFFGRVRPSRGDFPARRLLSYSIGVSADAGATYPDEDFVAIVAKDELAYRGHVLPTFFLQQKRTPLVALYGSCRKTHAEKTGDAFAQGDLMIEKFCDDLARRPAILCLGGDQVYADEVHKEARKQIDILVETKLLGAADREDAGVNLTGDRTEVLGTKANFTSSAMSNHVVLFAEYLALYGLYWNIRNWGTKPPELADFLSSVKRVRRLLANIATYMIFDDHDITDDWNLDIKWVEDVNGTDLGTRILGNALMAFWLCQGYGNDPAQFEDARDGLIRAIEERNRDWRTSAAAFGPKLDWEFATPTEPVIYFLDTRTHRGHGDPPRDTKRTAPAFLKSPKSWDLTMARLRPLLRDQRPELPIVLMAAVPVFGFGAIDLFQELLVAVTDQYDYDFEGWVGNVAQLDYLLDLFTSRNVVLLSGDVHYGYTATVRYAVFDSPKRRALGPRRLASGTLSPAPRGPSASYEVVSTAQYIQLTSSALHNDAGGRLTRYPAVISPTPLSTIVNEDGERLIGDYRQGAFVMVERDPADPRRLKFVRRTKEEVRPATLIHKRVNDAYNTGYVDPHNLGVVTFADTRVSHHFLTPSGNDALHPYSEHDWDFRNPQYWD